MLDQLRSLELVEHTASSTANVEIRELIKASDVGSLIEKAYKVRGLFVTNVPVPGRV